MIIKKGAKKEALKRTQYKRFNTMLGLQANRDDIEVFRAQLNRRTVEAYIEYVESQVKERHKGIEIRTKIIGNTIIVYPIDKSSIYYFRKSLVPEYGTDFK